MTTKSLNELTIIDRDESGEFVIPADLIAEDFGWSVQKFRDYMGRGMVFSRVEQGEGEDEGSWRLSVRCGNRRWQAIVGANGIVDSRNVAVLP